MTPLMNPQISILVPIYNVSSFIERCAHALFCQTFPDIEYVFVDDGTPDDSIIKLAKVIEQYPQRKEQVKIVIHPVNRGLAAARNTAIDNSSGTYLLQVDSDDWIEPDMVELLYHKAIETRADVVVCDYFTEGNGTARVTKDAVFNDMNKNRNAIIISSHSKASIWNKMIKREIYNRCHRLPQGLNYNEDRYIVVQLYFLTDKIAKVDKPLYHYVTNNATSITAQNRSRKHFENTFTCWDLLSDFLWEHGASEEQKNLLDVEKIKRKASLMIATNSYSLRKEYAQKWHQEEARFLSKLTRGKWVITCLIRHRLFLLAHLYHCGVKLLQLLRRL